MRYRLLLIFLALFLLAPGFWLQADWILNYPVSRVNYERLRVGMTLRQAEEIMGKPATHWPPPRILYDEIDSDGRPVLAINDSPADPFRFWTNEEQFRPYGVQRADTISDTHMIAIFLDPGGRVLGKSYMCAPDMSVARRPFDMLPFWSMFLTAVLGLLLIVYLGLRWPMKRRGLFGVYTPSVTIPAFFASKR